MKESARVADEHQQILALPQWIFNAKERVCVAVPTSTNLLEIAERPARSRSHDLATYKICVSSDDGRTYRNVLSGGEPQVPIHNWSVLGIELESKTRLVKNWVRTLYNLVADLGAALENPRRLPPGSVEFAAVFEDAQGNELAQVRIDNAGVIITLFAYDDSIWRTVFHWTSASADRRLHFSAPHTTDSIRTRPGYPLERFADIPVAAMADTIENSSGEMQGFCVIETVATAGLGDTVTPGNMEWLLHQDSQPNVPAFVILMKLALFRAR